MGPFSGASVGRCVCVLPVLSPYVVRSLSTFACVRVRACTTSGRERVSPQVADRHHEIEHATKGSASRNTNVYVQVRVVRMRRRTLLRSVCFQLSCKRLRKPQAVNMRRRTRSNTFWLRAVPAIIPSCLSDIPCLQRITLTGLLAI